MEKKYVLLIVGKEELVPSGEGSWDNVLDSLAEFEVNRGERFAGPYTEDQRQKMHNNLASQYKKNDYKLFKGYKSIHGYPFYIIPSSIEMSKYRSM